MVELWFALFTFMLVVFVVLDGWDIGAGALNMLVARTPAERREVIAAIGPLWSWHEVWLIAAGGTFLLAFPRIMAISFSGFYLALWMVLWSFVLRGVSIEIGGHINDALWQAAWDFVFAVSNVVLAILFGAALGNVIRGVPLDATGVFRMPLFTDFRVVGHVGLLDWYTVSVAVFATVLLSAHGATYLRFRTTGDVHDRSEKLAKRLWTATAGFFVVVSAETWIVRPELYAGMARRPIAWACLVVLFAAIWALTTGVRSHHERRAFAGSCTIVASLLGVAAAALFPVMLHSTLGSEYSLTAYAGATGRHGLAIALVWWPVALVLAAGYAGIIMWHYKGKVLPSQDTQGYY